MKTVSKMVHRSKKISEIGDEWLILDIEFPAVDGCRDFKGSMAMCLLELLVKVLVET